LASATLEARPNAMTAIREARVVFLKWGMGDS
jgi:hypothetical protein